MIPLLATLTYHAIFEDPLAIEQIHKFLITPDSIPFASVHRSVEQLLRKHQIIQRGPYHSLLSFLQQNVRQHTDRMKASQEKLAIARRAAKVISFVPWVKFIAVTGALAMENADESDDIDLMIVTSSNRLWFTRPLVLVLVSLFFKCRRPNLTNSTNLTNALCLNLWLDEDALAIPNNQRNLYTAHELAQMKPLVNRNETHERMMGDNRWGRKFLANCWNEMYKRTNVQTNKETNKLTNSTRETIASKLLRFVNKVCFQLQYRYMKPRMTTERVSLHAAYFHPGNRSGEILHRYQLLLEKMKIEKPKKNSGEALLELARHAVPGPKDLAGNMFEYLYGEKSDFATKKRKQTVK